MKYIVSVSGGLGSTEALKRTIETYGLANTLAVFADVKGDGSHHWLGMPNITRLLHERFGGESRDTYRFIWQTSHLLNIDIERLSDTDTIYDIFYRTKSLSPMTGVCKASELLKRERIARWIENKGMQAGTYSMVLGMGWDEEHRVKSSAIWWYNRMGWSVPVIAPNAKLGYMAQSIGKDANGKDKFIFIEYPFIGKDYKYATNEVTALWLQDNGIDTPSAYSNGLEHNNCGGNCVLAGLAHYAQIYQTNHDGYLYQAFMEYAIQKAIGKGYTILRNLRKGAHKVAMSLIEFADTDTTEAKLLNRPNIHNADFPKLDTGVCGCFADIDLLRDYVTRAPLPTKQLQLLTINEDAA